MALEWINKIVEKIAAEVHKSKIEEFEKRILEMEQKHAVILKTMIDMQNAMEKLEDRLYNANMESSKANGALQTLIQLYKPGTNNLPQE